MDTSRHVGGTALVTGAASGIGRATVVRLSAEGARIVAVDLHEEPLRQLGKEIEHGGGQIVPVAGDITDQRVVDTAVGAAGRRIDLLVNNAGIMDYFLPVDSIDDDTWARVIDVNTTAPMRFCRAVVPLMKAAGGGAIVNVASVAATMGGAAGVAYTASKHALVGMTRNIAVLYAPDRIRCNAICPGGVETNIAAGGGVPREAWVFERFSATSYPRSQRTATADEVAAVISWLGSSEASDVNGAVLPVDAGWSAF
ncbi:MAG TPA: SDR family NAD(P)-dependent oxidoreductase [Jatrophihabitans sp.]|nr:SDR family NAD(P)-dependent oxidoreductase [Jatrophihabitans sp.]